ncbi:cobalamin B12-binding domain-containing protein [Prosthecomicrobium sp. N25]|uniref:cobalamin B12-binding domain-containing protein n=1 Tax=Prosthecomicrobium sp. N25 TaxID=3129254 RepID=UPI003078963D
MELYSNATGQMSDGERFDQNGQGSYVSREEIGAGFKISLDDYILLSRTIQSEIIPRLLLTTRSGPKALPFHRVSPESTVHAPFSGDEVAHFSHLLLADDPSAASDHVDALRRAGREPGAIFLELFAPTARYFGTLWDADECSFFDVTRALGQLHIHLRRLGCELGIKVDPATLGLRVLLATLPGDQHTFGIAMVEELFRNAGWETVGLTAPSTAELCNAVSSEWHAIVGLSVSRDQVDDDLQLLIAELRRIAPNPRTYILVGGRYFNDHPEEVARVGADGSAVDGKQAILQMQALLGL